MGVALTVIAGVARMARQGVIAADQNRHGRGDIGSIFADRDQRMAPADVGLRATISFRPSCR